MWWIIWLITLFLFQILGALNSFCWLEYGLLIKDSPLAIVSLVGGIIMSLYTICFYIYCARRSAVRRQALGAFVFYVILWLYLSFASTSEEFGTHYCGLVCCGMSILFYASPLVNLVHVIRTRSTSTLPFPIILGNVFNTGLWWLYGVIIKDTFVKVPYCLGFCLAFIQLSLFLIFPSRRHSDNSGGFLNGHSRTQSVIQKKHFENGDRLLDYKLGWDILLWCFINCQLFLQHVITKICIKTLEILLLLQFIWLKMSKRFIIKNIIS